MKGKQIKRNNLFEEHNADNEEMDGYVLKNSYIKVLTFSVIVLKVTNFGG